MLAYRTHHGVPAHPQIAGHLRHRIPGLTHATARLPAGPFRQHRTRADPLVRLAPRSARAGRFGAAPDALAPYQPRGAPADRQVAHHDSSPTLRLGSHATLPAPHTRCGRLDQQHQFAALVVDDEHNEAVQSEQMRGKVDSVVHVCGLRVGVFCNRHPREATALLEEPDLRYRISAPPSFTAKSPLRRHAPLRPGRSEPRSHLLASIERRLRTPSPSHNARVVATLFDTRGAPATLLLRAAYLRHWLATSSRSVVTS